MAPSGPAAGGDLGQLLADGAAALGLALTDTATRRLLDYVALMQKWSAVYNLTAIRDPARILIEHVLDALSIVPPLRRRRDLDAATLADVGSGAGVPGLPLAILHPGARLLSIEPVGKKAAFQRQVQAELALTNVEIQTARAETVHRPTDIVVCRAFTSLQGFVTAAAGLTAATTLLAAMKGRRDEVDTEVGRLAGGWTVDIEPLTVPFLGAQRHLVLLEPAAAA